MTGPVDVVVAIPAHNEEDTIGDCLTTVGVALDHARREGAVARAVVAVGAHRCEDETVSRAQERLDHLDGVGIIVDAQSWSTVAEVRQGAVAAALHHVARPRSTLLLNTDADSLVPEDWITGMLASMVSIRASAATGMVELIGWEAPPAARLAYDAAIARGIHGTSHAHVYGANLAVSLAAFVTVGGFRPMVHGEDRDLVARLRAAGHTIATPFYPRVLTSGRLTPRCPAGLGAFLKRLVAQA